MELVHMCAGGCKSCWREAQSVGQDMSMLCAGCCDNQDAPAKTPLLHGQRTTSGGATGATVVTQQPASARASKPPLPPKPEVREEPHQMTVRPVRVADVDKRIVDHMTLYNEHVERWQTLKDAVNELRKMFPEENPQKTLRGAFSHLRILLGENAVEVKRRHQFCLEIEYSDVLMNPCLPRAFITFNRANKLVKIILDKGPMLVTSILLVVENEKELRREILVASLGADGPDCMKNCIENVNDLKKLPLAIEDIKNSTMDMFDELKAACQLLIENQDNTNV